MEVKKCISVLNKYLKHQLQKNLKAQRSFHTFRLPPLLISKAVFLLKWFLSLLLVLMYTIEGDYSQSRYRKKYIVKV